MIKRGNLANRINDALKLASGGNRVEIHVIDKETNKVVMDVKSDRPTHRLVLKF